MEFRPILSALMRNKAGALLIALQIAITLAVVTNALYILKQRQTHINRPTGIEATADAFVIYTRVFRNDINIEQLVDDDLLKIRALADLQAVTPIQSVPVSGGGWGEDFYLSQDQSSDQSVGFGNFMVNQDGVEALGLDLIEGRNFSTEEITFRSPVETVYPRIVLISKPLANALFPDGDALGQLVYDELNSPHPTRIIGIYENMPNAWPNATMFENSALMPQISASNDVRYWIRAKPGRRDQLMTEVEQLLGLDRNRIILGNRTFEEVKARTYRNDIAMVKLLSGVVALLTMVTAMGIIGLAWFSVTQRRKQIGTRRALGAHKMDILRYFMIENWLITSAGLAIGIVLTLALNYFLDTNFQTGRLVWYYIPVGMLFLWLLGQLAVLAPARKAANTDPALATRSV